MTEKKKTFLCTRPKLMTELIEQGFSCTKTTNPFNTKYSAWLFEINDSLAFSVLDYFNRNNLKLPTAILNYLQEQEAGVRQVQE